MGKLCNHENIASITGLFSAFLLRRIIRKQRSDFHPIHIYTYTWILKKKERKRKIVSLAVNEKVLELFCFIAFNFRKYQETMENAPFRISNDLNLDRKKLISCRTIAISLQFRVSTFAIR